MNIPVPPVPHKHLIYAHRSERALVTPGFAQHMEHVFLGVCETELLVGIQIFDHIANHGILPQVLRHLLVDCLLDSVKVQVRRHLHRRDKIMHSSPYMIPIACSLGLVPLAWTCWILHSTGVARNLGQSFAKRRAKPKGYFLRL